MWTGCSCLGLRLGRQTEHEAAESLTDMHTTEDQPTEGSIGQTAASKHIGMAPAERLTLTRARRAIVKDLYVPPLLDCLIEASVITTADAARISERGTREDQARNILDLLPQRGPRAFSVFKKHLADDHYWLAYELTEIAERIDEQDLNEYLQKEENDDPTTDELRQVLRLNLCEQLKQWKTPLDDRVLCQDGRAVYVDQPISAWETIYAQNKVRREYRSVNELLEQCLRGSRIMIYADAGMGKTTMLKHLAESWLDENSTLAQRFKFVFLIPMRLIRFSSLMEIICMDLKLIPRCTITRLEQAIELHSHNTLFLLDSYEEVPNFEFDDVDKLIKGELLPRSTVIVTSRPGSKLTQFQPKLCQLFRAQLHDIPPSLVEAYRDQLLSATSTRSRDILSITFLQTPINLSLSFMYLASMKGKARALTQTELFNAIVQHISLAYSKKKNLGEFEPSCRSPLGNKDAPSPEVKSILFSIAKKSFEAVKKNQMMLFIKEADHLTKDEFIQFGLFDIGPKQNSVMLPHPLFLEHFAAVYLASDVEAWEQVFAAIKNKAKKMQLEDAARPLENVIKFLVGLSPEIAHQVGSLFVIKHQKVLGENKTYQSLVHYEVELLQECADQNTQSHMLTALANAPIVVNNDEVLVEHGDTSHHLLPLLDYRKRAIFLKIAYGCELSKENRTLFRSRDIDKDFVWDSFVVALVQRSNYSIVMNKLVIGACDLPVCMVTGNMTGVRHLELQNSTLCTKIPDYIQPLDTAELAAPATKVQTSSNVSIRHVELWGVKGLHHLGQNDIILTGTQSFNLHFCKSVPLSLLKNVAPSLAQLTLTATRAVLDADLPKVKELHLAANREVDLRLLSQRFSNLARLTLFRCTLLLDVDTPIIGLKLDLGIARSVIQTKDGRCLSEDEAKICINKIIPSAFVHFSQD